MKTIKDRIEVAAFWTVVVSLTGIALALAIARGAVLTGYDALRQKLQPDSKNNTGKFSDKFQKNSDS
jgi:hypothetical protein